MSKSCGRPTTSCEHGTSRGRPSCDLGEAIGFGHPWCSVAVGVLNKPLGFCLARLGSPRFTPGFTNSPLRGCTLTHNRSGGNLDTLSGSLLRLGVRLLCSLATDVLCFTTRLRTAAYQIGYTLSNVTEHKLDASVPRLPPRNHSRN